MKIQTIISPLLTDELYYSGKIVLVIDVLRASSTIVTALENGAREIVPVSSLEFGQKASHNLFGGKTIRGGEKNMEKIDGFDLGNSPAEYSREMVADKSIIFFTTNGSKAIVKTKFAEESLIVAYLNLVSVVEHLVKINRDFSILCSGNNGSFSLEDFICAGRVISMVMESVNDVFLTDSSRTAMLICEKLNEPLEELLSNTDHGQLLVSKGYKDDIAFCSKLGLFKSIPIFKQGIIKKLNLN